MTFAYWHEIDDAPNPSLSGSSSRLPKQILFILLLNDGESMDVCFRQADAGTKSSFAGAVSGLKPDLAEIICPRSYKWHRELLSSMATCLTGAMPLSSKWLPPTRYQNSSERRNNLLSTQRQASRCCPGRSVHAYNIVIVSLSVLENLADGTNYT